MEAEHMVDLEGLSECEKASILEVLRRNNSLRHREDRRMRQLAVRVQMERLTDQRTIEDDIAIRTKTGEWHRDLVRKRCRGMSCDVTIDLYKRLSSNMRRNSLMKSRSSSISPTISPHLCSRSSSEKSPTFTEKSVGDINDNYTTLKTASIHEWSKKQAAYSNEASLRELPKNAEHLVQKFSNKGGSNNLSMNFKQEKNEQRDV